MINEHRLLVTDSMTKKNISDPIGQMACSQKPIPDTKRGKRMAPLQSSDEPNMHLNKTKGWLKNDNPFFDQIDRIVQDRAKHTPRVQKNIILILSPSRDVLEDSDIAKPNQK